MSTQRSRANNMSMGLPSTAQGNTRQQQPGIMKITIVKAELQDHHKRFKHIFCRCLTGNKESETTAIYMNNPQLNPHWDESIESLCPKDKNEIRIDVKKKDHYYSKEVMIGSVTLSFPKEAFSGLPLNRTIYLKDNKGSEMIDSINLNFQFRATQSSDSSRPSGRQTRSTDSQIVSLARKQSGILKITIAEVNLQYYPMYSEIFCRCCIGTKVMETCTIPITDRRRMEWKNTPLECSWPSGADCIHIKIMKKSSSNFEMEMGLASIVIPEEAFSGKPLQLTSDVLDDNTYVSNGTITMTFQFESKQSIQRVPPERNQPESHQSREEHKADTRNNINTETKGMKQTPLLELAKGRNSATGGNYKNEVRNVTTVTVSAQRVNDNLVRNDDHRTPTDVPVDWSRSSGENDRDDQHINEEPEHEQDQEGMMEWESNEKTIDKERNNAHAHDQRIVPTKNTKQSENKSSPKKTGKKKDGDKASDNKQGNNVSSQHCQTSTGNNKNKDDEQSPHSEKEKEKEKGKRAVETKPTEAVSGQSKNAKNTKDQEIEQTNVHDEDTDTCNIIVYKNDRGGKKTKKDNKKNKHESTEEHKYGVPRGIPNIGATCYANSAFQALGQTPGLLESLTDITQSKLTPVQRMLKDLLQELRSGYSSVVNREKVQSIMQHVIRRDSSFRLGLQNDCHSFLLSLINNMKQEVKGECLAAQIFEGEMCNRFSYNTCSHKEDSDAQMFSSLLIPVDTHTGRSRWSVEDGLNVLTEKEEFPDNLLPCRECEKSSYKTGAPKGRSSSQGVAGCLGGSSEDPIASLNHRSGTVTTKQLCITTLPQILILHIARFKEVEYRFTKSLRKIEQNVAYPEMLWVDQLCPEKTGVYQLYAVLSHTGSLSGGHYYATVRRMNTSEWFYCSDSWVDERSYRRTEPYNDSNAYVLFYHLRRDLR